jgi:hypothetical protein
MKTTVAPLVVAVTLISGSSFLCAEVLVEVPSGPYHVGLGGGTYAEGVAVRVQAAPAVGYRFVRWDGDVPAGRETENPLEFVPTGDANLRAVVEPTDDPWAGWARTRILSWHPTNNNPTLRFAGTNLVRRLGLVGYQMAQLLDGTVVRLSGTRPNHEGFFQLGGRVVDLVSGLTHVLVQLDDGRVADISDTTQSGPLLPGGLEQVRQIAVGQYSKGALFVLQNGGLASTFPDQLPSLVRHLYPARLAAVRAASLGQDHALVALEDGRVLAWGGNGAGQTNVPPDLPPAVSVVAGISNSFAIHTDGSVTGWGNIPAGWNLAALRDVVDLCVVKAGLAALRRDGTVWNHAGEPIPGLERVVQITFLSVPSERFYALAVERVGVIQRMLAQQVLRAGEPLSLEAPIWGPHGAQWFHNGQPLSEATNLTLRLVNSTRAHSGLYQVAAWDAQAAVSESVQVCVLEPHVTGSGQVQARWLAETAELEVRAEPDTGWKWRQWNLSPDRRVVRLPAAIALQGVEVQVEFVPAEAHTVSVATSGRGWVAGAGVYDAGRVIRLTAAPEVGWRFSRWTAGVAAERQHENPLEFELAGDLALEAEFVPAENPRAGWFEGRVFAWRQNWQFTEVDTDPFAAISGNDVGPLSGGLLLRTDGSVAELKAFGGTPVTVPGISNAVAITRGTDRVYGYAILDDGRVIELPGTRPVAPPGLVAVEVDAGWGYGLARKADGTVVQWQQEQDTAITPPPAGLDEVWQITCGWSHALALRADGRLVSWGLFQTSGPHPPPEDLPPVISVSSLLEHDLALLEDGSVRAWGSNQAGESLIVPGYTNAAAVAAGFFASMIINRQGLPLVWGSLGYGSSPPPAGLRDVVDLAAVKEGYLMALVGTEVGLALPAPRDYQLRPGQRVVLHPRFHAARAYAWYKDGQLLPNQTRPFLKLGPATAADAGVYHVVAFGQQRALSYRMTVQVTAAPPPALGLVLDPASGLVELRWEPPLPAPATLETSVNLGDWEPALELPAGANSRSVPWNATDPARFFRLRFTP